MILSKTTFRKGCAKMTDLVLPFLKVDSGMTDLVLPFLKVDSG